MSILYLAIAIATLLGVGYLIKGICIDPLIEFNERKQKLIEKLHVYRQFYYNFPTDRDWYSKELSDTEKQKLQEVYDNFRKGGSYFVSIANRLSLKVWYLLFYRRLSFEEDMHILKKNLVYLSNITFGTPEGLNSYQIKHIMKIEESFERILKFKFEYKDK